MMDRPVKTKTKGCVVSRHISWTINYTIPSLLDARPAE
jgi:hypothetical protein